MPKLRVLSADDVIKILLRYHFSIESQRGSHIKLSRIVHGEKQVLIVPNHKELDKGTLKGIFKQASRYIDESDLRKDFFTA
jgi:predicted RNA binding protein YcfA (HicA-like mRNA interferase family)